MATVNFTKPPERAGEATAYHHIEALNTHTNPHTHTPTPPRSPEAVSRASPGLLQGAQLPKDLSIHLFQGPLSKQEASLKQEANKACLVTTYFIGELICLHFSI